MGKKRNTMTTAARVLALSDALRDGEELTIVDVQEACDVQYHQARTYLKVIEDTQPLRTKRRGRKKVWYWAGRSSWRNTPITVEEEGT